MFRLIGRLLIFLFFVALLLAIFAPSILSTHFGKYAIIRLLQNMSGYQIEAKELDLHWMKGQLAKDINVFDKRGRLIFHTDSAAASAPLWRIIFYHDVGKLQMQAPFFLVDPSGKLTAQNAPQQACFFPSITIVPSFCLLGDITISQGSAQFSSPDISIKEVDLSASLLPKQVKLKASGLAEKGSFELQLLAYPGTDQIETHAIVDNFPVAAADQTVSLFYPDMKGVLREMIGENLSGELRLKNMQDNLDLFFNASSDSFSAHLETNVKQDRLVLTSPALFQFQIPENLFYRFTSTSIKEAIPCEIKLDELSIPLHNHTHFTVHGTLKSGAIDVDDWRLDPLSLYVGTEQDGWGVKIDSPQIQLNGSFLLPQGGRPFSFTAEALMPKNTKMTISAQSLKSITLAIQSDLGSGQIKGAFDPIKKTVALTEKSSLTFLLTQLPALLKEPLPVQLTLQPCLLNLQTKTGSFKGQIKTPAFELQGAQIDPATGHFTGDLKLQQIEFSLISKVNQGPLSANGTLSWPFKMNIKGSSDKLPTHLIQPFLKTGPEMTTLLGETLTTNFQVLFSEDNLSLQLKTVSPCLSLEAMLKTTKGQFELLEPANFSWTLTPQGYTSLMQWLGSDSPAALSEPALFKGAIQSLSFPDDIHYQGKLSADQIVFGGGKVKDLQIQLDHLNPKSPHQFQAQAAVLPQGKLSCQGNWSPSGSANIHLLLDQFPTAAFDLFASPFKKDLVFLSSLFGPTLNLTLDTRLDQWSGPLKIDLRSANLRSSLRGSLQQGMLTLSDPFHLQFDLNSSSSKLLFQKINPLSLSSARSEGPITLEIAPHGFSYPLQSFDPSKIQIGTGRLELGKVHCKNEGNIQETLGLLKLSKYHAGDELKLWFAPLDFHIQNGLLNCQRTELLIADSLQVCLWGDVNFPKNSIDAILGLTANALQKAFGIKNLPSDYVLQIPIQGDLADPKIDKGRATARIGALLIWQQKGSAAGMAKGPAGALLGELMNKIGPLPGGDQKAPPAKTPFPWQSEDHKPLKKKKISSADQKIIHPDDSALRQAVKLLR